jgi:hypothetical protein
MLALLRSRSLFHSTQCFQIRTIRTLPREIPSYVKRWDPTLYISLRPPTGSHEARNAADARLHDVIAGTVKREALRDAYSSGTLFRDGFGNRISLKRLSRILHLASDTEGRDMRFRAQLWRAYMLAKAQDSSLLVRMTDRAWDILWNSRSTGSRPDNRRRRAHLEQLYRDMNTAGKTATAAQRAQYLENIFVRGEEEQALSEWEKDHNIVLDGIRQDYKPEHLEVGARLHALAGNVDRGRNIMEELLKLYPTWDTSVMMVVFRAHTSSALREHHDHARPIYAAMKERRGDAVVIEDYDAWLVGFLEARHLGYAKQVFRDMVKEGHIAPSGSAERVDQVLKRLHMLYRLGTDISKMTSIALDAISVLPPAYHGHLFGDWMKSAVVRKAPEAAAQILDMMIKRGYVPETFHYNMLLKALIRTQADPNILRAENIGWRMIEQARKAERRRHQSLTTAEIIDEKSSSSRSVDPDSAKNTPVANVTTFALIMHHHAKSLQWEHVDYLSRQLKNSAIKPNATIMNVLMDNKCRQGAYASAWHIYQTLTSPAEGDQGIFPNGASIRCLWKTLRLALASPATRSDPHLPTPRDLLKETVEWWKLSRSRYDADRFLQGFAAADHGAITALIMHCFSYTSDLAGSLVALHVLRKYFSIYPTDKAAQILQRQMAWVDMSLETDSVRSQHFHSRSNNRNTERIARVYQILLERRLARMDLKEEEYEALSDEQIGDVGLDLLSEFVRVVMKRGFPAEVVEVMVQAAASSVGVEGLETGDLRAWDVV